MPVGPELPPHLAKRKRSIDDSEPPNSPPRKVQAASLPEPRVVGPAAPPTQNPDELQLDQDSSDDDYGPSLETSKTAAPTSRPTRPAPEANPTLPPPKNPDELDLDASSSDEDNYGPSKPPTKAPVGPTRPEAPTPAKRVLGPSLPPADLSDRPSHPANPADSSSDSEDDYGPALPPAAGSREETQLLQERAEAARAQEAQEQAQARAAPKRDDWMVVPPSDGSWGSRVDPTKLKNRKFQSGKGSKAPTEKGGGISALWTETPEQKRQRLEDEVLGRTEAALNSSGKSQAGAAASASRVSKEDEATARRIQEYNERNRNRSLYDEHSKKEGIKEKEDDPSKRGFDREKDMAVGGRLGHGEKREMLAKAKDFGSRFQKGRYL